MVTRLQRRRPHRAGRPGATTRRCTLDGKPSVGLVDLPAARLQRPGHRRPRPGQDGGAARRASPRASTTRSSTTPRRSSRESISEVFKTLRDAVILVAIVVLLFLQDWRSAHHPADRRAGGDHRHVRRHGGAGLQPEQPDAVRPGAGDRHRGRRRHRGGRERRAPDRARAVAARGRRSRRWSEVTGPVIAIGAGADARCSCPARSSRGITGQFFRQFALTIAVSTIISAFNSLTLSPALAALLLRPQRARAAPRSRCRGSAFPLGRRPGWAASSWPPLAGRGAAPLAATGRDVARCRGRWSARPSAALVGWLVWPAAEPRPRLVLPRLQPRLRRGRPTVYAPVGRLAAAGQRRSCCWSTAACSALTYCGFDADADRLHSHAGQGLPAGQRAAARRRLAASGRSEVMQRIEKIAARDAGRRRTRVAIAGQSILLNANAPNFGSMFVMLDDFHDRTRPRARRPTPSPPQLQDALQDEIRDGAGQRLRRPAGRRPGHRRRLQDRWSRTAATSACDALQDVGRQDRRRRATSTPGLRGLFTSFRANTPWLYLDIDRDQGQDRWACRSSDVFNTLQVYLGSLYVNDFNRFGRTWQVNVQADADFRKQIEDLKQLKVRNDQGEMVPLGTLADVRDSQRPGDDHALQHVPGGRRSTATPAPGVSSGQAIDADGSSSPTRSCRRRCATEWTELALLQTPDRQHGHVRLRAGGGAGVPGAGRAVRKLVAAAGRDPGRADVPAVLDRRRGAGAAWTSTSSRRSASSCWSAWPARTRS